jgi:hypothetical protein
LQTLLLERSIEERQTWRNRIIEDDAAHGGINYTTNILLNGRTQNVLRIVFLG